MIEMMLFVLKISKIQSIAQETYWRHASWIIQKNIAIKLFSVQITFGINNLTSYLNVESSIIIIERRSLFGSRPLIQGSQNVIFGFPVLTYQATGRPGSVRVRIKDLKWWWNLIGISGLDGLLYLWMTKLMILLCVELKQNLISVTDQA